MHMVRLCECWVQRDGKGVMHTIGGRIRDDLRLALFADGENWTAYLISHDKRGFDDAPQNHRDAAKNLEDKNNER